MNDELLEDRMHRRAQEWPVGEPPHRAILGEGRRLRRRRRQWIGGVAASVAVLGLTLGGLAIAPGGPAPESVPAGPAAPPAEGRWVAVDGVALDVPSDWTSPLTVCEEEPFLSWKMLGGADPGDIDPCTGAGAFSIQFTNVTAQQITALTGEEAQPPNAEVDGVEHYRKPTECFEMKPGGVDRWCAGSVRFPDRDLSVGILGDVSEELIDQLLASVRVLPDGVVPDPPVPSRPSSSEAVGNQIVGIADISFEVPAAWTQEPSACGQARVGRVSLDAGRADRRMCSWDHVGDSGSIRFLDLAEDAADRAKIATTFTGLPDRGQIDGRGEISCHEDSCSVAIYLADPGVRVTIVSRDGEDAVQRILDSLEIVPADERS